MLGDPGKCLPADRKVVPGGLRPAAAHALLRRAARGSLGVLLQLRGLARARGRTGGRTHSVCRGGLVRAIRLAAGVAVGWRGAEGRSAARRILLRGGTNNPGRVRAPSTRNGGQRALGRAAAQRRAGCARHGRVGRGGRGCPLSSRCLWRGMWRGCGRRRGYNVNRAERLEVCQSVRSAARVLPSSAGCGQGWEVVASGQWMFGGMLSASL